MQLIRLTLTLVLLAGLSIAQSRTPSLESAQKLLDRGKYERAESAFAAIVEEQPDTGEAWFGLGSARHAQGNYEGALEANTRAATYSRRRDTALYNIACAQALLGRSDAAIESIDLAIEAGFLDFDLMQSDTDIASIRGRIDLPEPRAFEELRARNGITMRYEIQLPMGYDAEKEYPALVVFSPGGQGVLSTTWSIENMFGEGAREAGWILLHVVAPDRGWMTHPSHHALEDLLKHVRKEYQVQDNVYHGFGFGRGARAATTYSRMSSRYFRSLTVASSFAWQGWDDSDLKDFRKEPVRLLVGELDSASRHEAERVSLLFEKYGVDARTQVIPDAGRLIEALRGADLMRAITTALP